MIRLKRAYEPAMASDGYRVLVDRLWPRGLRKEDAHLDEWLKDLSPSVALRKWFGHDPNRFREFRERYKRELHAAPAANELLDALANRAAHATLTLVYSAHDEEHNNAVVLAEELQRRITALRSTRRSPKRPVDHAAHARR